MRLGVALAVIAPVPPAGHAVVGHVDGGWQRVSDTGTSGAAAGSDGWPSLLVADWTDTRDTLHMWTQIVGKIRLARRRMVNHWWQAALYVTPRGLTTSAIPDGHRLFDIEFDFLDSRMLRAHERRWRAHGRARAPVGRRLLRRDHGCPARAGHRRRHTTRPHGGDPGDPLRGGHRARVVRRRRGAAVLAAAGARPTGCWHEFRSALRRQGQPGALLLGQLRPGVHPVLRPDRAHRIPAARPTARTG